jgi:DNA polymerase III epsilon subunit family exonuclease
MALKPSLKSWIFLFAIVAVIFAVILGSFIGSWLSLDPAEQQLVRGIFDKLLPFPFLGALALVMIIGTLVSLLFRYYIIPILQLAEKARLITTVNPGYRIALSGAREVRHLTAVINDAAEAYQNLQREVDARIQAAQTELNEERNRLAALMSDLPSGVLVCNTGGQILLYNQQARNLLQRSGGKHSLTGTWIGLGRSIFTALDREPIAAGLEQQLLGAGKERPAPPSSFQTTLPDGTCLRVRLAPVFHPGAEGVELTGFVLTLEDMTAQIAATVQRERTIRELDDAFAAALAGLQQAASRHCEALPGRGSLCAEVETIIRGTNDRLQRIHQDSLSPPPPADEETKSTAEAPPVADASAAPGPVLIRPRPAIQERPVFYEFDLFRQPPESDAGHRLLRELTYVVFDTETTGLHPADGDEIIQLGAVRIVKGRILLNESIDQLIDPRRSIPRSSVAIHGITPDLLIGQPTIEEILPTFRTFVEGAVLVAHNAAFDMKFLNLKQARTGIVFDQPVLDTLLLSSIVHPNLGTHALDAIAARLDIPIVGRHTAFGDAIVTAEVLLKLIPLLEAQGIHTLEEALEAAARSPYARIKF